MQMNKNVLLVPFEKLAALFFYLKKKNIISNFHTCTAQKVSLKIQTSNTAGQPVDYITSAQPLKPYIFCFTGTCK